VWGAAVAFVARGTGRKALACLGLAVACVTSAPASRGAAAQQLAPDRTLRVLAANPRYFTDGSGRAVYLTGSHVWWNLAGDETWDFCLRNPAAPFSYDAYLRDLVGHGHNFVRLWAYELIRWNSCGKIVSLDFHPWVRTGPGLAVDGKPRFDLTRFDPRYFARLRDRVQRAQRQGLYVSVMLFEGWAIQFEEDGWGWKGHPFNPLNNANGLDGDVNSDGRGLEVHSLANPRVLSIQEAYVRRVIDTVNGFDNVLYEIANESGTYSTAWQYRMIDFIKRHERLKAKRHPVGMTYQHGDHAGRALAASRADWISPFAGGPAALVDPPPADGRKVTVLDTDHLCGVCGDAAFVWKSFLRGHNPIYMDPFDAQPVRVAARVAMGLTRRYARRIDLRHARPRVDVASTRFALARPGREYLVYQPGAGRFWIDLGHRAATWAGEWLDPASARVVRFRTRRAPGRSWFTPPSSGPAVLLLRRL
jgi:hypothetical protein